MGGREKRENEEKGRKKRKEGKKDRVMGGREGGRDTERQRCMCAC